MIKKLLLSFVLCMSISISVLAQGKFSINGTVSDDKGPLPGASIFVSGYKMGTSTNNDGKFTLPQLAPGNYDILVQMIGYQPFKQKVIIDDKSVSITVLLKEDAKLLNEVVVKGVRNKSDRAAYLKIFMELFIGQTPNAEQCELLNPDDVIFEYDKEDEILKGTSKALLNIENRALGYQIKYLLEGFEFNKKTKIYYFAGQPFFEDMKGTAAREKKWIKARELAYYGSRQHFFKSLYSNTITQEGYVINKVAKKLNPNRRPIEEIEANIKRLTQVRRNTIKVSEMGFDSLSYWLKERDEPMITTFDTAKVKTDTLARVYNKDMKMMDFKDALLVIYKEERETNRYFNSGNWQERPNGVPNYQVSIINRVAPKILFYANGTISVARSIVYQGYWAYEKIADLVPYDYIPRPK